MRIKSEVNGKVKVVTELAIPVLVKLICKECDIEMKYINTVSNHKLKYTQYKYKCSKCEAEKIEYRQYPYVDYISINDYLELNAEG